MIYIAPTSGKNWGTFIN